MSKDTPKLVEHALTTLSKVAESDTNVSTIDLNLLENLNTNQSLNYIKLEKNLNELEGNGKHLQLLKKEFDHHAELLVDIERKITKLEAVVNELDSWSKELKTDLKR
ncbi:hypothetical protein KGF57_003231 [Candida theae]|uniref:Uncharacterized protein n=1 Tax=Candida theae TaxID=1198502 RepID=A0AAD5BDH1_9ASCO|nr:uncharacterized protein KGF57_003231 [Candida theae]KAI5957537.1 hypothetical protein KGF57_003231 [Candida theae]